MAQPEGERLKKENQKEKKNPNRRGREGELKSDGLSSLGQPATVKAVIYSAVISLDI